jgi:hypothetical protein
MGKMTGQAKIQQIAQREIMVSQYEHEYFNLTRFKCIPFIGKDEKVHGQRLILEGNTKQQSGHSHKHKATDAGCGNRCDQIQLINILDEDPIDPYNSYNNTLLYRSKHIKYGYQRFFNQNTSFK